MSLVIKTPGTASFVQDGGRAAYRHWGVPSCGAADPLSLALANYCVRNPSNAAGVEMCLTGLTGTFTKQTDFAFCGANVDAKLGNKTLHSGQGYTAQASDTLSFAHITNGARCYLAISGSMKAQKFLGSKASYSYAGIGAFDGRALQRNDTLSFESPTGFIQNLPAYFTPRYSSTLILRVMPGPEWDSLAADSQKHLTRTPFIASAQTNRMGARMTGQSIKLTSKTPISSSPILPGTVQIPPGGAPILMLVDSHCTGGYARALQVIRADRYLLGQIGPSTRIYFRLTDADDARLILKRRSAMYQSLMPDFSF